MVNIDRKTEKDRKKERNFREGRNGESVQTKLHKTTGDHERTNIFVRSANVFVRSANIFVCTANLHGASLYVRAADVLRSAAARLLRGTTASGLHSGTASAAAGASTANESAYGRSVLLSK